MPRYLVLERDNQGEITSTRGRSAEVTHDCGEGEHLCPSCAEHYTRESDGNIYSKDGKTVVVPFTPLRVEKPFWLRMPNDTEVFSHQVRGIYKYKDNRYIHDGHLVETAVPTRLRGRVLPKIFVTLYPILGNSLRHLYLKEQDVDGLAWSMVGDKPAMKYRKTVKKTGKLLRQLLPKYITDSKVQECARVLDQSNPQVAYQLSLMNPDVYSGLRGAENGRSTLGSCMHGHRRWEKLDQFLTQSDETLESIQRPPTESSGVQTIYWEGVPREVSQGHGVLRAFLWPVIHNGERKWYLDRVYPASNHARQWTQEFCEAMGIPLNNADYHKNVGSGAYAERAAAQPSMIVPLKHMLVPFSDVGLPWLDTFTRLSGDLLSLQTIKYVEEECAGAHSGAEALSTGAWGYDGDHAVTCPECGREAMLMDLSATRGRVTGCVHC